MDNALREKWAFGFQNRINHGVHSLCDGNRNAIFYISSHSGVIYDYRNCTQTIIRGHSDLIKCCVVSKDKKFIITCDSGKESRIIIWDSRSGTPIKTIMNAHARGVDAVDISADGQLIVTIGISTVHALSFPCSSLLCVHRPTTELNNVFVLRFLCHFVQIA
jgi:cilia- and flagella-associated protein 251